MRKAVLTIAICLLGSVIIPLQADDMSDRLQALDKVIDESRRTHDEEKLATALLTRTLTFYNNAMSDSVYAHVPKDLETLRSLGQWDKYYEVWSYLINTYIYYSRSQTTALREVQSMFNDAMKRDNKYGMGIAYYTMGNVYLNMNNLEQSADSYLKGLQILSELSPIPMITQEVYSYYGDVLNEQKKFKELEQFVVQWKQFLDNFTQQYKLSDEEKKILWFYYHIACAQAAMGNGDDSSAETILEEAHRCLTSEENYEGVTWLFNKAQLLLQQGHYAEALQLNDHRMRLISPDEDKAIYLSVAFQRADILSRIGRYEESSGLYREMYVVKDSISNADTKNQLNEMNTLFKVDELEMEKERAQFRNTMIIVGLIILALVIFSIFRYIAAKRLKVAHEKLQTTHEELLTAYDQLEETTTAKERIESDLRIARDIQQSMIPQKFPPFPERTDIDLFASMTPAKAVGGDLYDFILLDDKLYFCLGDVSGKGVPASLFMAVARNLFRVVSQQGLPAAEIADKLNNALSEDNDSGMFVTMFIGIADLQTGRLDFCNAGHNPPVIKMPDGTTHFLEMQPNAPLGLWTGLPYEGEHVDDISGCPFFVYSDGLNEAENDKQEQYGDDLLLEMLEKHEFVSSQQTVEMMKADVVRHANGAEQSDDLTMLCVKIKGNLPKL